MNEPTPAEIMRRLDEVARQLATLSQQMREDRHEQARTYVRQDVYSAEHGSVVQRVIDLETSDTMREKQAADTRRQVVFLLLSVAIPAVAGLLLSLNTFLTTRG